MPGDIKRGCQFVETRFVKLSHGENRERNIEGETSMHFAKSNSETKYGETNLSHSGSVFT